MTELLRDLQDSMLALDQRVSGLETARDQASAETRRLAISVVEMGDALARRVRALEASGPPAEPAAETPPAPQPPDPPATILAPRATRKKPDRRAAWVIGLGLLIGMALAGWWVSRGQLSLPTTPSAAPASAPAPVPAPPQAVAPAPVPAPVATSAAKPTTHHWTAQHHAKPAPATPYPEPSTVPYKSLTNSIN